MKLACLDDDPQTIEREAERLLARWEFTADDGGVLRIRPRLPALDFDELACLLKRLRETCDSPAVREIVLDLSAARLVGRRPELFEKLLAGFTRFLHTRGRICFRGARTRSEEN
jgi:hypothetical protein